MKYKAGDVIQYIMGVRECDHDVYTVVMTFQDKYLVRTPTGWLWEVKFKTFDSQEYRLYPGLESASTPSDTATLAHIG